MSADAPAPDAPDTRTRWNARFAAATPELAPHPLVTVLQVTAGARVLELACGPSGSALALAAAGAQVLAVDVSDVALAQLAAEAARRGLAARLTTLQADLGAWTPPAAGFDLVFATRFWDAAVFARAAAAVAPGGTLAWETFTLAERAHRPGFAAAFCLRDGEPASLLPPDFQVLRAEDLDDGKSATRRLVARRG